MSVYNSAGSLTRTLDSILLQEGVDFEFIVIDDGSTDGSGEILDQRAALDARLVVVHQDNAGLTAALRLGASSHAAYTLPAKMPAVTSPCPRDLRRNCERWRAVQKRSWSAAALVSLDPTMSFCLT
ncbi:MAG: glycosyltransferase family 2 protein [Xanthomonadales bacterium]|nr:glycosyltransferase family 2 protein [Xanthomonadales bacterium]